MNRPDELVFVLNGREALDQIGYTELYDEGRKSLRDFFGAGAGGWSAEEAQAWLRLFEDFVEDEAVEYAGRLCTQLTHQVRLQFPAAWVTVRFVPYAEAQAWAEVEAVSDERQLDVWEPAQVATALPGGGGLPVDMCSRQNVVDGERKAHRFPLRRFVDWRQSRTWPEGSVVTLCPIGLLYPIRVGQ